jgi:hypothetical protein
MEPALKAHQEKIEWYRERAADCERLAKTAPDERAKATLKEMAATWERLASVIAKWELD